VRRPYHLWLVLVGVMEQDRKVCGTFCISESGVQHSVSPEEAGLAGCCLLGIGPGSASNGDGAQLRFEGVNDIILRV
jgi:hypothetical protein